MLFVPSDNVWSNGTCLNNNIRDRLTAEQLWNKHFQRSHKLQEMSQCWIALWITSSLLKSSSRNGICFVPQRIVVDRFLCRFMFFFVKSVWCTECDTGGHELCRKSKLRSSKQLRIVLVCVLLLPSLLPPLFPKPTASFPWGAASLPPNLYFQITTLLFSIFLISM